ncbi:hypothetical protein BU26DRAFT_506791 [Trematosphaeria pertusa]|uniref:RING-type domain-containing protein n=1 Tax=Trematosphaeria pertusa TaxID=390896 RepID=A0A6A6IBJ6_9PLEO|nr:uncharacterized protein BU26DRAFT_506791 [Trematosphaeria pertusa]KAF2247577.1 hypothetical protein BU26DRAFT_506791 [Trematosphaeria pertusa]
MAPGAPPTDIRALPGLLSKMNTSTLPISSIPCEDMRCNTCWRDYGEKNDPADPHEVVCQPVRILPCKHLVGSECLARLVRDGRLACTLCRQPIRKTSPVPRWVNWLLEMENDLSPTCWIESAREELINTCGTQSEHIWRFDALNAGLLEGTLTIADGVELWLYYIYDPLFLHFEEIGKFLTMLLPFAILEWFLPHLPDTWAFPKYLAYLSGMDAGLCVPILNTIALFPILIVVSIHFQEFAQGPNRRQLKMVLWNVPLAFFVQNLTQVVPVWLAVAAMTVPLGVLMAVLGILICLGIMAERPALHRM